MICGIDPGVSGAIAFVRSGRPDEVDNVVDMPTMQRGKTGNKQQINGTVLASLLMANNPEHVYLEHVNGMPPKGRSIGSASAFNFGHSFGLIEGVLQALQLSYTLVQPQKWKADAGLSGVKSKDLSRTRAIQLFSHLSPYLMRKKDVGRAEALLIARYGSVLEVSL